jgi:LPXTG-motif cell wall-anchored protein
MRYVVRSARRIGALLAVAALGIMLMAVPAVAQTSTITQADCDAGRITQNGKPISKDACQARIGQKVNLASTGFEAWMLGLGGIALMGGATVVLMRRRPSRTLA